VLIEGSSIAPEIIQKVRSHADGVDRVLVSAGNYCIVFDTVVEDLPDGYLRRVS
jgi:cephalosporin hydroxylase